MTVLSWMMDAQVAVLFWLLASVAVSAMVIEDIGSDEVFHSDPNAEADTSAETDDVLLTLQPANLCTPCREILKQIGWNCSLVTPIANIALETIMGRWYLLEVISSNDERQDACAGVDLWRWEDNSGVLEPEVPLAPDPKPGYLVMRGFNRQGLERTSGFRIDTTVVVNGSGNAIWDQTDLGHSAGMTVAVLDYSADRRFLTVNTCERECGHSWTSVLGRQADTAALRRLQLHRRLKRAGVAHVGRALLQNNTGCVYR